MKKSNTKLWKAGSHDSTFHYYFENITCLLILLSFIKEYLIKKHSAVIIIINNSSNIL